MSEKLSLTIVDRNNPEGKATYYFDTEIERQIFVKALEITLKDRVDTSEYHKYIESQK